MIRRPSAWARRACRRAASLAVFVVLAVAAGEAGAHGGQFRPPGGGKPPGSGMGPAPVPQVITPGETWQTWWDLNRLNLLPGREAMLHAGPITTTGDGPAVDPYDGWEQRRVLATRQQVVPFLCRLLDPRRDVRDEIRAAALIALGKISLDGATRMFFVRTLRDAKERALVRESAALAIGLLCRSRPEHQLPARILDELRAELLRALDDEDAEVTVRAFSALSLGLLGDQPTAQDGEADGSPVVRGLWAALLRDPSGPDLPVAILTAIGLQPRAGVPVAVLDGLRALALGLRRPGLSLAAGPRSHAVTALARLGAPGVDTVLLQLLQGRRVDTEIRRAAFLAAGRRARDVDAATRVKLARAVANALDAARDPLARGLGLVAAGRLLGTDLEASNVGVLQETSIPRRLFEAAEKGTTGERGYATLALALAARGARASGAALPFLSKTKALMLVGLEDGRGDDTVRAAYAVGLGLLAVEEGVDPLLGVVRDGGALPIFRGHAAVALGQIGRRRDEVRPTLREVLTAERDVLLRMRAAFSLALLGDAEGRDRLLDELEEARTELHRSHVVIALGRLGDLGAVGRLLAYAEDEKRSELARALGVVALGLILDPEPRPSLMKLREDANFPAATAVLYSAFAIF